MERYLVYAGEHRNRLSGQLEVIQKLNSISYLVAKAKEADRKKLLEENLSKIVIPENFIIPVSPSLRAKKIIVDKCKYMDSFTVPLWIVFENVDPFADQYSVIFKSGDDLRQDSLTIQLLREMDDLWKRAGKDSQMMIYSVLPTGRNQGLIEVVPNSKTNAKIQKEAAGASGAFLKTPLARWLQSENQEEADYAEAVSKFIVSCAGYCVASYVLGLGDRHNDNIMITKSGQIFHIDFGHFLGNTMKFGGYNRERAPFVLTPEYLHVMGGDKSETYQQFIEHSISVYQLLRKNYDIIKILFFLMVSAGIPELSSIDDLSYLQRALRPELMEEKAAKKIYHLN